MMVLLWYRFGIWVQMDISSQKSQFKPLSHLHGSQVDSLRFMTVHKTVVETWGNVGKRQLNRLHPPTSAYNRGYPWRNTRGRRMLREFVNIRRHPPPSATRPPAVSQTWYKRDRNVIASASKRLQTPTNAYKCCHPCRTANR